MMRSKKLLMVMTMTLAVVGLQAVASQGASAKMIYEGGPIQHKPHVHIIYWGSNWNKAGDPAETREKMSTLFSNLSGSAYQGILTQYFDKDGLSVSSTVEFNSSKDVYVDESVAAPQNIYYGTFFEEISKAKSAKGWSSTNDDQYIVIPAPESSYKPPFGVGNCGFHQTASPGPTIFLHYASDGCFSYGNYTTIANAITAEASHEYAESITDLKSGEERAWSDPENSFGTEIADLCTFEKSDVLPSGAMVERLWDNHLGKCVSSDPSPPQIKVEATEAVSTDVAHQVVLKGVVNPGGYSTSYHIEWGTSTSYGSSTSSQSIGSGTSDVSVNQTISSLSAGTTYHYRLVEETGLGTAYSADATFTPAKWTPTISGESATYPGQKAATLNASINPRGLETHYWFEYDTSKYSEGGSGHGTSVPIPAKSIGSGSEPVAVSETVKGLEANTTYHFRTVAENSEGVSYGKDGVFTTGAQFRGEEYPVAFKGELTSEFELKANGITTKCKVVNLSGSASAASSTLTLTPSYSKCTRAGIGVTVTPHGCSYVLHSTNEAAPFTGTLDIACANEGESIEIAGFGCKLTLPAQSGLGAVEFANSGKGRSRAIVSTLNLSGVKGTYATGCPKSQVGTFENGTLKETSTIKGSNEKGAYALGVYLANEQIDEPPLLSAEKYPATLKGEAAKPNFSFAVGKFSCNSSTLWATISAATAKMSATPVFSGCSLAGNSFTVQNNGCEFTLTLAGGGPPNVAGMGLTCPGSPMTFTSAICTITIGSQEWPGAVQFENTGSGSTRGVKLHATITGMKYEQSSCSGGNGSFTNGQLEAEWPLQAFSANGAEQLGLWIA